ncbi:MAG: cytochrome c [Burkholderiales bacterium]|nr:MAG: cytochrome c [Burkholderiales bacterium]
MAHASESNQEGVGAIPRPRGRRRRVTPAVLAAIATLVVLAQGPVRAQAPGAPDSPARTPATERGRALYETRCIGCHERSVHQRESRRAQDFASLRGEVARWNTTAGGEWRDEELDAVAAYLNDRFYRFPCPTTVCRAPARAALPAGGG